MTPHLSTADARRVGVACVLLTTLTVTACDNGTKDMNAATVNASSSGTSDASMTTEEALRRLSAQRVYFGHQSVGGNILAGLDSLLPSQQSKLNVVKTRDLASVTGPAFVHFPVGRNEDPASKNADFLSVLDGRKSRDSAIALFKYCYVDVNLETDIDALFDGYRRTVAEVKSKHPDVTLVHVTLPLTTGQSGLKGFVKRVIGRPSTWDINQRRNRFNNQLRSEFAGEPIFDLATLESTRPDGSREQATLRGETVYAMAPDYTPDGGHLNAEAQRRFAEQLVKVLASAVRP